MLFLSACGNNATQYRKVKYDNMVVEIPVYLPSASIDSISSTDTTYLRLVAENDKKKLLIEPMLNRKFSSLTANFTLDAEFNESYVENNDTCVIVKAAKDMFVGYRIYMNKGIANQDYLIIFMADDNIVDDAKHIYNSMALENNISDEVIPERSNDTAVESGYLNYQGDNFIISYPKIWTICKDPTGISECVFNAGNDNGFSITVLPIVLNLRNAYNYIVEQSQENGIVISTPIHLRINGFPAYKYNETWNYNGTSYSFLSFLIEDNGTVINIKFGVTSNWLKTNEENIDVIINSFKYISR